MSPDRAIVSGDAIADLFGDAGEAFARRLADGDRLTARSAGGGDGSRYSLIPWPALTVRLSELGFVIEHVVLDRDDDDNADAAVCQIDARKTDTIVRAYRAGDEDAIRDLFARSFHQELTEAMWRWRYLDHPLGSTRITVARAAGDRLVGHYGGYPVALDDYLNGHPRTLLAHQNGDVMTAPDARRLGRGTASLVGRMARHFWAAYGEGRVDAHYGFNTDTARALQLRVVPGVRALEDVRVWTCGDPPVRLAREESDDDLRVERVSRFDAGWDAFAARVGPAYGLLTRRDAAYLNWRHAARPDRDDVRLAVRADGRIVGLGVFQLRADETRWGDALFDPREPRAAAAMLMHLRSLDAAMPIRAWFSPRPAWWTRQLDGLGFRPAPEPHGLTLVFAPFTAIAERSLPEWYYTWGDSDLF